MNRTRTEALSALLDDIAAFEIKVNDYWADSEPQGYYDTLLTGLINSLLAFCQTLGWSELVGHLRDMTPLATATDRDEQQGYMQIMAGSMTGIRNPKAHGNLNPDSTKALHLICLASLLMRRLDERI